MESYYNVVQKWFSGNQPPLSTDNSSETEKKSITKIRYEEFANNLNCCQKKHEKR